MLRSASSPTPDRLWFNEAGDLTSPAVAAATTAAAVATAAAVVSTAVQERADGSEEGRPATSEMPLLTSGGATAPDRASLPSAKNAFFSPFASASAITSPFGADLSISPFASASLFGSPKGGSAIPAPSFGSPFSTDSAAHMSNSEDRNASRGWDRGGDTSAEQPQPKEHSIGELGTWPPQPTTMASPFGSFPAFGPLEEEEEQAADAPPNAEFSPFGVAGDIDASDTRSSIESEAGGGPASVESSDHILAGEPAIASAAITVPGLWDDAGAGPGRTVPLLMPRKGEESGASGPPRSPRAGFFRGSIGKTASISLRVDLSDEFGGCAMSDPPPLPSPGGTAGGAEVQLDGSDRLLLSPKISQGVFDLALSPKGSPGGSTVHSTAWITI